MKIIHAISSLSKNAGGPSRSVSLLCEGLSKLGSYIIIITQKFSLKENENIIPNPKLVHTDFIPAWKLPFLNFSYTPYFLHHIVERCKKINAQIIHDHGLWLPSNHSAAVASTKLGVPLLISPRGMLEPWALGYKALKKKLIWRLYQKRDLQRAQVLHATSKREAVNLRSFGFRQPIAVITNGVIVPRIDQKSNKSDRKSTALFLSRIHPVKGLLNLVKAWGSARPDDWEMIIAGPDERGHRAEVELAIRNAGLEDVFRFMGPVSDEKKWSVYQQADLFILPTFSENFGVVVAEALASGVPVITTKGAPWEELETYKCGWWVDIGVEPLAKALKEATSISSEERHQMGLRGRKLVEEKYSWPKIAADMKAVYEWVLSGGTPPGCVIMD